MAEEHPVRGLDRTEKILFVLGIVAFALFILLFGGDNELPIIGIWVVAGFGFVWWFDHHLKSR